MLQKYMELAVILNFLVDFLLLLGTNRLSGYPPGVPRAAMAASLGALMTAAGFLPGFGFLKNFLWRIVSLGLMSSMAFGWSLGGLRRGFVFVLLNMAMYGIAQGIGGSPILSAAGAAVILLVICVFGFRGAIGGKHFIPVELTYGGSSLRILALQDTGNTLRDPVTGRPVLVVDAEVASRLTGLTEEQLKKPVESMGVLPGLRLVPYQTIGQSGGLLLAMKLPNVKIGTYRGSSLVAFAPRSLDSEGAYQALTGGVI